MQHVLCGRYADDLLIVAEHREELQSALEEWNDMFINMA